MKQIESHHISKSEYGVITLIINTSYKWMHYVFIENPLTFMLEVSINNEEDDLVLERLHLDKEEFGFDKSKEGLYRRLEQQEKDQIVFYWIPLRLLKGDAYTNEFVKRLNTKNDK